jgi:hypothetical protein
MLNTPSTRVTFENKTDPVMEECILLIQFQPYMAIYKFYFAKTENY